MATAFVLARLLLIAVFLVAGVTKLLDRSEFCQALREFGVPSGIAPPVAALVPVGELAVAAALLPTGSARQAAVGAIGLLALFTATMAFSLVRGRRPRCRCFGKVSSSEVRWRSLARNGVLGLVAGFVAWSGSHHRVPSATAWIATLNGRDWATVVIAVTVVVLLTIQGWLIGNLLRQQGRLLARVTVLEGSSRDSMDPEPAAPEPAIGLPVGRMAPDFALPDLNGEMQTLHTLRSAGTAVMLVFSDPACGPCTALLPELGRWQKEHATNLTISVVSTGDPVVNRAKATAAGVNNVLLQHGYEVAEAFRFAGTPSALVVGVDGRIARPMAVGADAIQGLVAASVGGSAALAEAGHTNRNGSKARNVTNGSNGRSSTAPGTSAVGQLAPAFVLPDLDGRQVESAGFRGQETLLLFWSPQCGYCQQMLPALHNWEDRRTSIDPVLVVVSRGSVETNREMRLESLVLIDTDYSVASLFGAGGTPTAVVVDAEGRVASPVAAGAQAVMALAARDPHWLLADTKGQR